MQDLLWFLVACCSCLRLVCGQTQQGQSPAAVLIPFLDPEYIKGLNYLLNEQQDKAIDVFIRMLEVNSDTVETHLALGNLFRKRGEVDRAIRIHQNLIASDSTKQRAAYGCECLSLARIT